MPSPPPRLRAHRQARGPRRPGAGLPVTTAARPRRARAAERAPLPLPYSWQGTRELAVHAGRCSWCRVTRPSRRSPEGRTLNRVGANRHVIAPAPPGRDARDAPAGPAAAEGRAGSADEHESGRQDVAHLDVRRRSLTSRANRDREPDRVAAAHHALVRDLPDHEIRSLRRRSRIRRVTIVQTRVAPPVAGALTVIGAE